MFSENNSATVISSTDWCVGTAHKYGASSRLQCHAATLGMGLYRPQKMMVAMMLGEIRWDLGSESEGNKEKDSRATQAGPPESLSYTPAESPYSQATAPGVLPASRSTP